MTPLPGGTVTFLFTDIEGSTRLLGRYPAQYARALLQHDAIMRAAVESQGGVVFETIGDAVYAAFAKPGLAVGAAVRAQLDLLRADWGDLGTLRVRMAIHSGEVERRGDHYFGAPLYRCARLMAIGHGGQVLVSRVVGDAVAGWLPPEVGLRNMGMHRLKDLAEPETVLQLTHSEFPTDFPPLRSLDPIASNLPTASNDFIGRLHERSIVPKLLANTRLLTLTGPGGIGKTRLAVQVAADALAEFDGGVWLVPLAAIRDPALLLPAIASVLRINERPGEPLLRAVTSDIGSKELLLVLDNLEQLDGAAEVVAVLMAACAGLKILATSRVPLHLQAERQFAVPPLGSRSSEWPVAQRSQPSDAVALFVQRAMSVRSDLVLDEAELATIERICARLDGLPLAIELAAAQVKALSPRAIMERLDQRLPELVGGPRDLPERQRTLASTIAWSYDLLSETERLTFRRLSIFAGGCTFESAERVCGADPKVVVSLLDKSLLQRDEISDAELRFRMLETIREFASARLDESDEAEEMQDALRLFFVEFARSFIQRKVQFPSVELEHANLRSVVAGVRSKSESALVRRVVAALWPAWGQAAHSTETEGWVREAVQDIDEDAPEVRGQLLMAAGAFASIRGNKSEAISRFEDALILWRSLDDPYLCTCLSMLALELAGAGRHEDAIRVGDEAVASARTAVGLPALIDALVNRAEVARLTNDDELALRLDEEALPLARKTHMEPLATLLINIAQLRLRRGDAKGSRELLREAIDRARAVRHAAILAYAVATAGGLSIAEQSPREGVRLLASARAALSSLRITMMETDRLEFDRSVEIARRALNRAVFDSAWAEGMALSLQEAAEEALSVCTHD